MRIVIYRLSLKAEHTGQCANKLIFSSWTWDFTSAQKRDLNSHDPVASDILSGATSFKTAMSDILLHRELALHFVELLSKLWNAAECHGCHKGCSFHWNFLQGMPHFWLNIRIMKLSRLAILYLKKILQMTLNAAKTFISSYISR